MNNWKVISATAVIFGAGVITGGVLVHYGQHCSSKAARKVEAKPAVHTTATASNGVARPADAVRTPHSPEMLSKQFLHNLDEGLHLTAEQREAVQKIIGDSQNLMRKTLQDARLEIREVLTPEQRLQFDELIKRPFHKPLNFGTNAPAGSLPATSSPVAK